MAASLTWVRDNYDANRNRYIDQNEFYRAEEHFQGGEITEEQLEAVYGAHNRHTLLPAYVTSPSVAKGKIINFSYPSTTKQGGRIAIKAAIQNSGDKQGSFKLQLYRGTSRVAQSTQFTVAANSTGATRTLYVTTPGSGASIAYTIKCARLV